VKTRRDHRRNSKLNVQFLSFATASYACSVPKIRVISVTGGLPSGFCARPWRQVFTDAQSVLTRTNPAGTADALRFAQQVETEAAAQGYTPNDIFVTGHSLGGWEAEYVAQNTGLGGIGFESLGLATTVPGNGADSLFVNTSTYGDPASFSSNLPGLQPFAPTYVPGGGIYPHYGPIVMLGDPNSQTPLTNAAQLWGTGIVGDLAFSGTRPLTRIRGLLRPGLYRSRGRHHSRVPRGGINGRDPY
jgi:hypothetical protein